MKYSEKLKNPLWQKKRLSIMERDGWKCVKCGNTNVELQVNHKKYIRGREPWQYDDDNLETLCKGCHAEYHGKKEEKPIVNRISIQIDLDVIDFNRDDSSQIELKQADSSRTEDRRNEIVNIKFKSNKPF